MRYQVTTPVKGVTATVAGVSFKDGVAVAEIDESALAYFRRHGYTVQPVASATTAEQTRQPTPADQPQPTPAEPAQPAEPKKRRTR